MLNSLMKCHDTELGEGAKNNIGVRVMYMFNVVRATQNEQRVEDHSWVRKLIDLRFTMLFLSSFTLAELAGSHREAIYASVVGKYGESRCGWAAIPASNFVAKRIPVVRSFQSKYDLCIHDISANSTSFNWNIRFKCICGADYIPQLFISCWSF